MINQAGLIIYYHTAKHTREILNDCAHFTMPSSVPGTFLYSQLAMVVCCVRRVLNSARIWSISKSNFRVKFENRHDRHSKSQN